MANIRIEVLRDSTQVDIYSIYISQELTSALCKEICELFYNKSIQHCNYYVYNSNLEEVEYKLMRSDAEWGIEIGLLPGITDNTGRTVEQIVKDYLVNKGCIDKNTYVRGQSAKMILGKGYVHDMQQLFNPAIEHYHLIYAENSCDLSTSKSSYCKSSLTTHGTINFSAKSISLNVSDSELSLKGSDGLGLSLAAMKAIKTYYCTLGRDPYDIELESLAQTWSEHCKHNIFSSPIDEIEDGLYAHYIKRATQNIQSDICVSVFSDNAGGIIFDNEYLIVEKVETHNSPSALDPFGGAMTGILGVNRDIVGFGKGAEPIMNTYYFCFAHNTQGQLYRDKGCKSKVLSPKFIMREVVRGVNVGGNCSGIPTQLGSVYFNDRFRGKPLVFVGSLGIIPRNINNVPSHVKEARDGDKIVIAGGRVGRDGIHGATFSSEALSEKSQVTSVQIGDPITQKKLFDAIIEARNLGLYNAITDNGAGGLSSSIGEMGQNGFVVDLSKVLLKNTDIAPWEIWVSESQERMTLAVPQHNIPMLQQIMKKHDVELSIIGEFNHSKKAVVKTFPESQPIMDIDIHFLHDGNPKVHLQTKPWTKQPMKRAETNARTNSITFELKEMLSRPNICSKEFIAVQYDHEVQGSSVLKPLQGKGRVCSEAVVLRPVLSSTRCIATSQGFGSSYGEIDTYHMAACAIDTAIRNCVAIGGNIRHLALLDNFCWSDSKNPERLWQLKRAAEACYDYATSFATPFISGKDSMFNDFKGYDETGTEIMISAPPSLLISAVSVIENIENSVSLDVKIPGDLIYILGMTYDELGYSEYQLYSGISNNNVPKVDAVSAKKLYTLYNKATQAGLIASAIAPNLGGLVIALVKSLIAGDLGAEVDLASVPANNINIRSVMFSESQSRILVTIAPQNKKRFEEMFSGTTFAHIGRVTEKKVFDIKDVLMVKLADLSYRYKIKDLLQNV